MLENLKLAVRFRVVKGSGRTFLSFVHSVKLVIENESLVLLGYDSKDQDVSEFDFWLTTDPIDQDAFRIIESFCAYRIEDVSRAAKLNVDRT